MAYLSIMRFKAIHILRLLPFAAWLWAQVAMAAAGPAAPAHAPQPSALAALSAMLPGEEIVLCHADAHGPENPEPGGPHAHGLGCDWCQAFGQAVLPEPEAGLLHCASDGMATHVIAVGQAVPAAPSHDYLSRAPPI